MGKLIVGRILALIGGIILIIASFLLATCKSVGGGSHRLYWVNLHWFWGFSY